MYTFYARKSDRAWPRMVSNLLRSVATTLSLSSSIFGYTTVSYSKTQTKKVWLPMTSLMKRSLKILRRNLHTWLTYRRPEVIVNSELRIFLVYNTRSKWTFCTFLSLFFFLFHRIVLTYAALSTELSCGPKFHFAWQHACKGSDFSGVFCFRRPQRESGIWVFFFFPAGLLAVCWWVLSYRGCRVKLTRALPLSPLFSNLFKTILTTYQWLNTDKFK